MTLVTKESPLRGELLINEPLANYTTWHVGGPAKQLYKPVDINDLSEFLKTLSDTEIIIWLGLGSNMLIRDGGIPGTIIYPQTHLKNVEKISTNIVRVEAGVTCAKLAKYCAREGLGEGAFFAGIPGTVGGALAMNAGAFGGVTWTNVIAVETIDRQGRIYTRKADEYEIGYREVKKPVEEWFVAGHFQFPTGNIQQSEQAIRELLRKRNQTQPIGEFSCGSVFRNPPNNYAARLIEMCDLKGKKIGGAWVSEKHANFIINGDKSTAADIETLINLVQHEVERQTGIKLIPECHIVGVP